MRRTQIILAVFSIAAAWQTSLLVAIEPSGASSQPAEPADRSVLPFRVPQDPSTPVITMAFADPRFESPPAVAELSIFADGRVTATAVPSSRRLVTARFPEQEWLKVQKRLFAENELLDFQTDRLQESIDILRRQRRRPQPGPDAAVTILTVRGENFSHEIRCHAVGLTATQFPDLPDIQRLYACQQSLQNVVQVVRAGGYDQVNRTLRAVNTQLGRQIPGSGPLSPDDLRLVDAMPDGTRYLQFSRLPCADRHQPGLSRGLQSDGRFLMVSVYERPGRPLEISIIGDAALP